MEHHVMRIRIQRCCDCTLIWGHARCRERHTEQKGVLQVRIADILLTEYADEQGHRT